MFLRRGFMISCLLAAGIAFGATETRATTVFDIDVSGASVLSTYKTPTGAAAFLQFSFTQQGDDVAMTVTVDNTTGNAPFGRGATQSKLVGFAFQVPDLVSLVDFTGGGKFLPKLLSNDKSVKGGAFKGLTFDYGAGLKSKLISKKSPNKGLDPEDGTIDTVFLLTGMTEAEMARAFGAGFGAGDLALGLRFKKVGGAGYSGPASDKVLYAQQAGLISVSSAAPQQDVPIAQNPIPAGGVLLLSALLGGIVLRRRC